MGCCISNTIEIKKIELVVGESSAKNNCDEFVDISLSSEEEIPLKHLEEWRNMKISANKSLSESMGMQSTLFHSERKGTVGSKPGSIVDSFLISSPLIFKD